MRILIDTDIFLDVLFDRPKYIGDSIAVLHMCEDGFAEGVVSAITIADIYRILHEHLQDEDQCRKTMRIILSMVSVCGTREQDLTEALKIKNEDYEAALLAVCAKSADCSLIITRNKKRFIGTGIRCRTPEEFVI